MISSTRLLDAVAYSATLLGLAATTPEATRVSPAAILLLCGPAAALLLYYSLSAVLCCAAALYYAALLRCCGYSTILLCLSATVVRVR